MNSNKHETSKVAAYGVLFFIFITIAFTIFAYFVSFPLFLISLGILIVMLAVFIFCVSSGELIDPKELFIQHKSDSCILVKYQNYCYEIGNIDQLEALPERDINQVAVPYSIRVQLLNYLKKDKQFVADPHSDYTISLKDARKYIPTIQLCNTENKEEIVQDVKSKMGLSIMILIAAIVGLVVFQNDRHSLFYEISLIMVVVAIIAIAMNLKNKQAVQNDEIWRGDLYVYDRKWEYGYKGARYYYVRLWDGKQFIINQWFDVNSDLYNTAQAFTLYYSESDKPYIRLEKREEEKKEEII